jgi:hypothetical protein
MPRARNPKPIPTVARTTATIPVPPSRALGILIVVTLLCLVPFIDKAFCIDDPLFLWVAEQIQAHPLDFYGWQVNWFSTPTPLYVATKHPPLASYYLALLAGLCWLGRAATARGVAPGRLWRPVRNMVAGEIVLSATCLGGNCGLRDAGFSRLQHESDVRHDAALLLDVGRRPLGQRT